MKLQEKYWNLPAQQTLAVPGVTLLKKPTNSAIITCEVDIGTVGGKKKYKTCN
jgi:hypothetical protein